MATIAAVNARIQALNIEKEVVSIIEQTSEEILELNRQQLLDGVDKYGHDLRPTYLEDPYFKTKAQAQAYSNWKDRISPSSKRKSGVPNYYINGFFHNTIELEYSGDVFKYTSSFNGYDNIVRKSGDGVLGLNNDSKKIYIPRTFFPLLKKYIEDTTKLSLK